MGKVILRQHDSCDRRRDDPPQSRQLPGSKFANEFWNENRWLVDIEFSRSSYEKTAEVTIV